MLSCEPLPDLINLISAELAPIFESLNINVKDINIILSKRLAEADFAIPFQAIVNRRKATFDFIQEVADTINSHVSQLSEEEKQTRLVFSASSLSGFLNLHLNRVLVFELLSKLVLSSKRYGYTDTYKGKIAMVEHTSSNPNSPLHIGNLRNVVLGLHLARLLKAVGFDVIEEFYVNDMGAQIGLTLLGWEVAPTPSSVPEGIIEKVQKDDYWTGLVYAVMNSLDELQRAKEISFENLLEILNNSDPKSKLIEMKDQFPGSSDPLNSLSELVDRIPGLINKLLLASIEKWSGSNGKPTIYQASGALNLAYEQGEEEAVMRFRRMVNAVLKSVTLTLQRVNVFHDTYFYESELSWTGSTSHVLSYLAETPYFVPAEPTMGGYIDLDKFLDDFEAPRGKKGFPSPYPRFFVVRPDGSSLYSLRDAVYAVQKISRHDLSVNVVGGEQLLAQEKVLILSSMLTQGETREGVKRGRLCHFPYGLVKLTSGKMSGRRGRYVLADDLLDDLEEAVLEIMAPRWIKEGETRDKVMKVELIAKQIASAALKVTLLGSSPRNELIFNPQKACDFSEPSQAPFMLYNVTRVANVLKKAQNNELLNKAKETNQIDYSVINEDDGAWQLLLSFILSLPSAVKQAAIPPNTLIDPNVAFKLTPNLPEFGTHIVCDLLASFAVDFSSFYKRVRVLPSDDGSGDLSKCLGWLKLLEVFKAGADTCLELLAIDSPEFM
ncbi:hypothetical protein RCL1_005283 [Eukaryota sp. TZLM3-RCL]